nr:MAG TPA: hypothetical protein [Caudoviricetes sp.]DAQ78927.1 MAG TPA: hypothetical protein [Caudoviricetes sp.]
MRPATQCTSGGAFCSDAITPFRGCPRNGARKCYYKIRRFSA